MAEQKQNNTQEKIPYEDLVKGSIVFQQLGEEIQEMILNAKGEEQERYERIFTIEREGILRAKKDLLERNNLVVKNFTLQVKLIKKEKLKEDESIARQKEEEKGEALLDQLNNL
ncbi:hypothetical protein GF340_06200 [Candidatus Peregrinibacteria bacterium]|nr:hypothetical protein [Candidatus Peregrinibacteria bacterium]